MAWSGLKAEAVPPRVDRRLGQRARTATRPRRAGPAGRRDRARLARRHANKAGELPARLLRIAADAKNPAELRLDALAAVPGGLVNPDQSLFTFLISQLDREQTVATRTTAADVLARAKLTPTQLVRLADALRTAGPVEVDRLLAAFEQSTDECARPEAGRSPGRVVGASRA